MNKLEQELRKTTVLLKKNKKIDGIERNIISFAKGLNAEQLALLVIKIVSGLATPMHRKQLSKLLKESIDDEKIDTDTKEMISKLMDIIELVEPDRKKTMKVKDLLVGM